MKYCINFTKTFFSIIVLLCAYASSCHKNGPQPTLISLRSAVKKGDFLKVKKCLDNKEDPNTPDEHGSTPLHWACYYCTTENSLAIIEILIEKGGNINAQDTEGYSPLFWVIKRAQEKTNTSLDDQIIDKVVPMLLKAGANIKIKNTQQQTPLHWAVHHNDLKNTKILLKAGADPNQKDCNQQTPIALSIVKQNHPIFQMLSQAVQSQTH